MIHFCIIKIKLSRKEQIIRKTASFNDKIKNTLLIINIQPSREEYPAQQERKFHRQACLWNQWGDKTWWHPLSQEKGFIGDQLSPNAAKLHLEYLIEAFVWKQLSSQRGSHIWQPALYFFKQRFSLNLLFVSVLFFPYEKTIQSLCWHD